MRKVLLAWGLCVASLLLSAAEKYTVVCQKSEQLFHCGEEAKFQIYAFDNGELVRSGKVLVQVTLDGNRELSLFEADFAQSNPATVSATLDEPGFMLVSLVNKNKKPIRKKGSVTQAGAGFDPEKIQPGYTLPEDFMDFWDQTRKEVADLPVTAEKVDKFSTPEYTAYYLTVNTLNNEQLTGYLTIPTGKGTFPAYITVPGAGPGISLPNKKYARQDVITLSMNVHKFPTADNPAEQKRRYKKAGSDYRYRGAGNRDTYFFRSVYAGLDKAVSYVANLPEWDHKHMVYLGTSQGGGSGLILAALNKNITALAANVPALCDHGGYKLGRSSGWPRLYKRRNADAYAPYFDAALFARFVKIPAQLCCGFIDTTCSPSSVYAAYNQLGGEKEMIHVPLYGHDANTAVRKENKAFVRKHLGLE